MYAGLRPYRQDEFLMMQSVKAIKAAWKNLHEIQKHYAMVLSNRKTGKKSIMKQIVTQFFQNIH